MNTTRFSFLKQDPTPCYLQEMYFNNKNTNILRLKFWETILHVNINHKCHCQAVRIGKRSPKWQWLKDKERGKPMKKEQRKILRTGVRTSGETNTPASWLALICIWQAQKVGDKNVKKRESKQVGPLHWGQPAFTPRGCTILCLLNTTLSCNTGPLFQIFVAARHN